MMRGKRRGIDKVMAGLALAGLLMGLCWPGQAWGRTAEKWYRLGLVAYRGGEYTRAVTCFSQVIELNPRFAPAYNDRGSAYLMLRRYDLAIHDFSRALLIKPTLAAAYHNRGLAYTQKKMHWRAIGDYSRAIELKPDYAEALNNRGYAYAQLKLYRRALKDYDRALKIRPNFPLAKNNRANVAAILKKIEASGGQPQPAPRPAPVKPRPGPTATGGVKKPVRPTPAAPSRPSTARVKPTGPKPAAKPAAPLKPEPVQLTSAEKTRYQALAKRLTAHIKKKPKDATALYRRCYARRKLGLYRPALADCTEAIKVKPKWALAYVGRGAVYRCLAEYKSALADYKTALKLRPKMVLAWGGQAWLYATARDPRFKDPEKALGSARRAARLSNYNNGSVLDTLARALYLNQRYQSALGWIKRALQKNPGRKSWRETRDLIQKARDKHLGQLIARQTAKVAADARNAAALVERCRLYLKLGQLKRAGADCRRAIKVQPQNGRACLGLAAVQCQGGRYKSAIEFFEQALKKGAPQAMVLSGLARLYLTAKVKKWRNPKKALELAGRAAKLTQGKNGSVLDTLALAQYRNNQPKAARASARRAVAIDPDNADWRATLEKVSSRPGSRKRR